VGERAKRPDCPLHGQWSIRDLRWCTVENKGGSRHSAGERNVNPDIWLGAILYVSQYLTFISSLEGAKVYSPTGWGPWSDFRPWIRHWWKTEMLLAPHKKLRLRSGRRLFGGVYW